ncbi:MAG: NAD-dependent epimerase/dehydratase family protein [Clostridia bacterium]|nr:NAD-dependent epimerase/dehydratase family protein [Clostridia bacterium]
MKILLIGGTGTISTAITELLVKKEDVELYLLNRGNNQMPEGVNSIVCDINDVESVKEKIADLHFDAVADFIAFTTEHIKRDYEIFKDKCEQYVFISSASAYQKPLLNPVITEETPLDNPYWEYSRNKQKCEELLMELYKTKGFPATIVRPSHTYGNKSIPVAVHGKNGSYSVIKRMLEGKRVIVHGDGESFWTVTHNTDFAVAFLGILANKRAIGEIFHITSDERLTWNQIYRIIANILGVEYKPFYVSSSILAKLGPQYDLYGGLLGDKAQSVIFDNSKIKSYVKDFSAKTPFSKGAKITLDYIMSHKELQIEDKEFDLWCDEVIKKIESL